MALMAAKGTQATRDLTDIREMLVTVDCLEPKEKREILVALEDQAPPAWMENLDLRVTEEVLDHPEFLGKKELQGQLGDLDQKANLEEEVTLDQREELETTDQKEIRVNLGPRDRGD